MRSFVVIPARLASTRLPRKMMLAETGKPLIQHTYEAASQAKLPAGICVATDHVEIYQTVRRFGGQVEMTDVNARSGTDRVAEIARRMPDFDIFVNVQGDEPEIAGATIDTVVRLLEHHPEISMATAATPLRSREQLENPACVKVVCDASGRALYFSRSPIPHAREWRNELLTENPPRFLQHVGIYAYRRAFLFDFKELPASPLEEIEKLEQLRVLTSGYSILVGNVEHHAAGIDTPDDYRAFVARTKAS